MAPSSKGQIVYGRTEVESREMGGMSKKRKFGSPGSKTVVNEEEEGETGHVMGE